MKRAVGGRRRPGRPTGSTGDQTRARVLAAAVETFAQQGLAGTSMRDVSRRARIRVSSLYHYFPSKEALFEAVQERAQTQIRDIMLTVVGQGSDMREMAREAIGRLFDFFLKNRAYAQLSYRACLEGSGLGSDQHVLERWLGFLEGTLHPAERRGEVKDVDPALFMATVDALVHWHVVNDAFYRRLLGRGLDDPETASRAREHVISVALRTLGLE